MLKPYIISALIVLASLPAFSQEEEGWPFSNTEDSLDCAMTLSAYREFFKYDIYYYAIEPWRQVFDYCPASSENIYVDGITMYRSFIDTTADLSRKEGYIDTLMLIYDRRMVFFKGEGNVLGRKGIDLLRYRRSDIEEVQKAYDMLKQSIDLQGRKSRDMVMVTFISAGISLNIAGKLDHARLINDYFKVAGILDELVKRSSRWERARTTIDDNMLRSGVLTCEVIREYYEPRFEQEKHDKVFLENLINLSSISGCDRSDLYLDALENLYKIDPGPESAHNLAVLFISRNDFSKAINYLEEALSSETINLENRTLWYYELAVVSLGNKDYCKAIDYAREAISLNRDYGKAYILLGDAYIASRENLGDDFQQRAAFWAAADKYNKAVSVDPAVAEEANQKLNDYAEKYPDSEEVFFRDLKDGDSYLVEGCINENATIRSRK